ncbi:MAG: hypothetical protein H6Q64_396 [Firmicutes bacterium]|nr:hypothetical protein [Bacillota bacterium]
MDEYSYKKIDAYYREIFIIERNLADKNAGATN